MFQRTAGKETIGTLGVIYEQGKPDEFLFTGSVNLNAPESVEDFYLQAIKALTVHLKQRDDVQPDSDIAKQLTAITVRLNTLTPTGP